MAWPQALGLHLRYQLSLPLVNSHSPDPPLKTHILIQHLYSLIVLSDLYLTIKVQYACLKIHRQVDLTTIGWQILNHCNHNTIFQYTIELQTFDHRATLTALERNLGCRKVTTQCAEELKAGKCSTQNADVFKEKKINGKNLDEIGSFDSKQIDCFQTFKARNCVPIY